ncbi:MAG: glycoside hydrolase family 31 protein [Bacteroidales bacterium]|jgi:alpha-D-xyloside xylohydrolase|nr:glycoside hydrolase family 31 protein [Bacteroidales bacterium]
MKKFFLTTATALIFAGHLAAQNYQKTPNGIQSTINSAKVEVLFFNEATVQVLKSPAGHNFEKKSLSVVAEPQKVKFSVSERSGDLHLKSASLEVVVNLQSGQLAFYGKNGDLLLSEKSAAAFTGFDDAGVKTFSVEQSFALEKDEAIYGLGQHQNGKMSQRYMNYQKMVQGNVEDVVPFFQSVKGYGVFWDNYSPTTFTGNDAGISFLSEVGDCVDYYFMYGGNADGVIAQMRSLTGQAPMFPLWTFGYWQSKERYKSQNEIVDVVRKYRELGVPLDGIIQDWQYWGNNYLWNAMEFLSPEYNRPQQMIDNIHNLNAHFTISIWSSFGPHTKPYRDLEKGNMLYDIITWPQSGVETWPPNRDYPSGVRVYDAYNPAARDIYWNYASKGLFALGVDGWWMDSTEPDHLDFKPEDFDTKTALGSFRKVRNAYPLMSVGGVYEHQRAESSDKRVFILTRSAFAGQQRYGANTWSGDIQGTWQDLKNQIPAGLNFSLSGIPYWNSDIGGFFLAHYPKRLNDPEYRELYARWIQFGAFCPMMRSHGADAPREIWQFGKAGEPVFDAIAKYIRLRYRLLPYIYSNSWEVTAAQSSMMRALVMDFPQDKNVWDIHSEYMFGKSLLVSPVTEKSAKMKQVYLPAGADWYDFWTNEKLSGGQNVNKETPLDVMPLYVRAGAIVPCGHDVQFATEKSWDNLEIHIYAGANGQFTLYEDEFDNYNYEKGAFSTIHFAWNEKAKTLTIGARKGRFKGMLETRKFNIALVGEGEKTVSYNGKEVKIKF